MYQKYLAIALFTILVLTWTFLGDFRFLMFRYPALAGFPFGSRNYFVIFQDNSAYGELKFANGLYRGITFHEIDEDAQVDGVITLDFHFMETWVEHFEPIFVDGRELTKENLFANSLDKEIMEPLADTLIGKTLFPPWRIRGVLGLASDAFEEKHILANFSRSGLQKAFARRGWTGALPQSDSGDFLAVSHANHGSRYITRDVQYELDITDQKDILGNPIVVANLSVTLSHEGTHGVYLGVLRSMAPLGSDISEDQALGEITSLEPGQSVTYNYEYELPEYVWVKGQYHLHLHKQPGTHADRYRVIARAPEGVSFISDQFTVQENVASFETSLLIFEA